jgi:hypothetical protein
VCDVVIDHAGIHEASPLAPVIDMAQHRKAG